MINGKGIVMEVMEVQGGIILSGFIGRPTSVKRLARSQNRPSARPSSATTTKSSTSKYFPTPSTHYVGNGISYHLKRRCPMLSAERNCRIQIVGPIPSNS